MTESAHRAHSTGNAPPPATSAFSKYKEGMGFCAAVDTETGPDTGDKAEDLQGRVLHSKEKGLRLSHRQQHLRGRRCFERNIFLPLQNKRRAAGLL